MAVTTNRRGSIFEIVIDNPPVNALSSAVRRGLLAALEQAREDSGVTAIVVSGAGRGFSAGADIAEFDALRNNSAQARVYSETFDGALDAVWDLNIPVISMIRGFCVGGGLELACCTDLRIAAEGSRFEQGDPEGQEHSPRPVHAQRALARRGDR